MRHQTDQNERAKMMHVWMLILWVHFGPVVIPNIATKAECDRIGHDIFQLKTKTENDNLPFLARRDDTYECDAYLTAK
jgi:hypothetical protein